MDDGHATGTYAPWPGAADLADAAGALAARLPEPLAPLARLAYQYRWSWAATGRDLFPSINPHRWAVCEENPVRYLQEARADRLRRLAEDPSFVARAVDVERLVRQEQAEPFTEVDGISAERPVAFFCAEYGVHRSLPVYAGGLGVLAGDILKAASDLRVPMVAVGLMYRRGYFRQQMDRSGWQQEYWVDTDPERLPAALVTGSDGRAVTVSVDVRGRTVVAQVWRVDVGRVPLYLLDAERSENEPVDRWITAQLYTGDPWMRLAQYVLLGVGGVRALRAMGIHPGLLHLNEGHAALAALEVARSEVEAGAAGAGALAAARDRTVFTSHTPVPAGNDTYPRGQLLAALGGLPGQLHLAEDEVADLGATHPGDEIVGTTQLGLRLSRRANGVSRRHGEVAREMWHPMFPDRSVEEVPIGHVTNGVHVGTWMSGAMRDVLSAHLGPGWEHSADPGTWAAIDSIPDEVLWATRNELRRRLVEFVRQRGGVDRLSRGEPEEYARAAATAFDPDALTLGFARRLATYKRLSLLTHDAGRALQILAGDRPVQIVIAGKAHPRDDEAKRMVQALFALRDQPVVAHRVAYIHEYDMSVAARLVAGCDVWLNVPRPPLEASGTSGMKSVLNGGLQLSVLDGWWAEAFDGTNGWAIDGDPGPDDAALDARHAESLYRLLEQEVIPEFHDRDERGVPVRWMRRVKASMRTLVPRFSADRMVRDYVSGVYGR